MHLRISLRKQEFHRSCFLSTIPLPLSSAFSISSCMAEPQTLSSEASSPLLDALAYSLHDSCSCTLSPLHCKRFPSLLNHCHQHKMYNNMSCIKNIGEDRAPWTVLSLQGHMISQALLLWSVSLKDFPHFLLSHSYSSSTFISMTLCICVRVCVLVTQLCPTL